MNKLLTIIIPAFNMEQYLDRAIESCILSEARLLSTLDVLVVNDGSTDRTSSIAHAWQAQHPDVVRVIDKPNGNYGSCINVALPQAAGTFVHVLDADDTLVSAALAQLVQRLADIPPEVDLVVTDHCRVNPEGQVLMTSAYGLDATRLLTLDDCCACELLGLHSVTYRTDLFTRFPYHQTEGCSYTDTEWIMAPMAFVRQVVYLPIVACRYLIGRAGQTMERETYNRNFFMSSRITLGLAQYYEACLDRIQPTSRNYLHQHLCELIGVIYKFHFYKCPGCRNYPNDDLAFFDRRLREITPVLYAEMSSYKPLARHIPFCPIQVYRDSGSHRHPKIWLYGFLSRTLGGLKRVLLHGF